MSALKGPLTTILLVACGALATPVFSQGIGGATAVKDNLDLPFDATSAAEADEDSPEVIVLYAQQYEGDGFVFVSDSTG
jgi:hypothetical protein